MKSELQITGSLLGRNTLLNFIGQIVPLVVGIITLPVVVHILGTERFGLLSLTWVILGYFSVFDLGLGRATAKFAAEALSIGRDDEIPSLVFMAALGQMILGAIGGAFFVGITPVLVERVLNVSQELIEESIVTFRVLGFAIPVVLISSSFRGLLEAAQKFDLINGLQVPLGILTYILPLLAILGGMGLPGIVTLVLLSRLGALVIYIILVSRLFFNRKPYFSLNLFLRLFHYGSWITVTLAVNPFLIYLDRVWIASFLSVAELTYYTVPVELATRLQIIPASLTMTLFSAFSALQASGNREKLEIIFARSIKYISLALGLFNIIVALFGPEILCCWLGLNFAQKSSVVLRVVSLGILINSLAYVPSSLLSGAGRPDIPAKLHFLELPLYAGILWLLACQWGIAGVACAWTLRILIDAILLFRASFKVYNLSWHKLFSIRIALAGLGLFVFASYALRFALQGSILVRVLASIAFILLFCWISWAKILDIMDRGVFLQSLLAVFKMRG